MHTHLPAAALPEIPTLHALPSPATLARWRDSVYLLGQEIGSPLTRALERVCALGAAGRIDAESLQALCDDIDRARWVGIRGQQLARIATGELRQWPERIDLAEAVHDALGPRTREAATRGIAVSHALIPVDVMIDATQLQGLVQAVLEWAFAQEGAAVVLGTDLVDWPPLARLRCRCLGLAPSRLALADPQAPPADDSTVLRLIEELSASLGAVVERSQGGDEHILTIDFPQVLIDGTDAAGLRGSAPPTDAAVLAGCHLLAVAGSRALRRQVREALRHVPMMVDFVSSAEEFATFCRNAAPDAVVFEGILESERFRRERTGIAAQRPGVVFVEIVAQRHAPAQARGGEADITSDGVSARLAADELPGALPGILARLLRLPR